MLCKQTMATYNAKKIGLVIIKIKNLLHVLKWATTFYYPNNPTYPTSVAMQTEHKHSQEGGNHKCVLGEIFKSYECERFTK